MKQHKPQRGIFEKCPGSDIWWIRYTGADGRYHREKAGTWSQAETLLTVRRNDAIIGQKMPETIRRRVVSFGELCDDTKAYIEKRYSKPKHDLGRLEVIRTWFGDRSAASVELRDIEGKLDEAK